MLVLEWKGRAFIEKVNSRCFCWFPAAILVDSFCPPIWRLHTKLYKGAWNVSATNSETVGHKDLRFGQIVYILVFYNISFSWLLPLDGFKCIFLCRVYCVTVKTKNNSRNSTCNCNLLNVILRNPIYTLTISLKPIKDMQQHTVFPSCAKYLYITFAWYRTGSAMHFKPEADWTI